ncbi:MAG: alpha/beta hydrolase [Clostridia bacterium]|nr:alpha/beta hydrolase [Clostridia bacterium]
MIKTKEKKSIMKIVRNVILIVLSVIILLSAVIVGMCLFNSRPAVQTVATYQQKYSGAIINMQDDGGVEILPNDGAASKNTGIIFYVGAQITPDAYIPLLSRLSEEGYSCFIPNLSFNMAALEPKAAEIIINEHPEIGSWYIAGHSMGGLTASGFAADNPDKIDGLIMLAAYTNRDLSESDLPMLSIYGDTDGVMNRDLYTERMAWNSKNFEEHIIAGANHAQYGDYGRQPRDNDALISAESQQKQTADIMLEWLKERQ